VVGFYWPQVSSEVSKENKVLLQGQEEVEKYFVVYPTIEPHFVAAKQKADFIGRFVEEMIDVLVFPE